MAQVVERHLAVRLHYVRMVPYDLDIEDCMKSFTPYVHPVASSRKVPKRGFVASTKKYLKCDQ